MIDFSAVTSWRAVYPSVLSCFPSHRAFLKSSNSTWNLRKPHYQVRWRNKVATIVHRGTRWKKGSSGISRRAKWRAKPFRELWDVLLEGAEMYMQSKTEGQRVTDLLAMFLYIRVLLDKADILTWNNILHANMKKAVCMILIASCLCVLFSNVFVCYRSYYYDIYHYVLYSGYICCQNYSFYRFFPLPSLTLYEEIAHSNDTVRGTSG